MQQRLFAYEELTIVRDGPYITQTREVKMTVQYAVEVAIENWTEPK